MCQSFVSVILVVHVSVRWSTTDKPLDSPCRAYIIIPVSQKKNSLLDQESKRALFHTSYDFLWFI